MVSSIGETKLSSSASYWLSGINKSTKEDFKAQMTSIGLMLSGAKDTGVYALKDPEANQKGSDKKKAPTPDSIGYFNNQTDLEGIRYSRFLNLEA